MRAREFLSEKRKNPKQNVRLSLKDQLTKIIEQNNGNMDNLYIRFTDDNKLGINPQHSYATPFGICAYPFKYVYDRMEDNTVNVPFAGDRKYMIIFKADNMSNALDLQNTPLMKSRIKIINSSSKILGDQASKELVKFNIHSTKTLWRKIYDIVRKNSNNPREEGINMMKILKSAGYNMVIDHGDGIIHQKEPEQSIFLSSSGLSMIQTIENHDWRPYDVFDPYGDQYYADKMGPTDGFKYIRSRKSNQQLTNDELVSKTPHIVTSMRKPSPKQLEMYYNWAVKNPVDYYYSDTKLQLPHKYQILMIKEDPKNIGYLPNAPETVMKSAVYEDYMALLWINKPTENVIMIALAECKKLVPIRYSYFLKLILRETNFPNQQTKDKVKQLYQQEMRETEFIKEENIKEWKEKALAWIKKVYDLYPHTWQNNHVMLWGEGDDQQLAMFELIPSLTKGAVEVKWFQAYPLRSGVGTKAMHELQKLANNDGISLTLYPWDKGTVSQSSLIKFYKKQGFKPLNKGSKNLIWHGSSEFINEANIDNKTGAGVVSKNQDIDYWGFRCMMRPSTFLKLAAPLGTPPKAELKKYITGGGSIASPMLWVDIPSGWSNGDFSEPAEVINHEGRNRMTIIQELEGDEPIEVHIVASYYYRAEHMTPDFISNLNSGMFAEKSDSWSNVKSDLITGPLFTVGR